jgi:acetyl-CoA synthetase
MDYQRLFDTWKWRIPERYNLAADCVDRNTKIRHRKNKVALYWENSRGERKRLTFLDIALLSNRFGNGLKALGISKGDRFVIRLGNVPEFQIAFLGGIKIGALPVPTSIMLSSRELETRLEDTAAVAVVTASEYIGEVEAVWGRCPSLRTVIVVGAQERSLQTAQGRRVSYQSLMEKASSHLLAEDTRADDEAFICYSSCTTGEPKGIVHAHRWAIANDPSALYWQGYQEDDVMACTGPLSWIFPLGNAFVYAWRHGASVFQYDGDFDPEKWFHLLEEHSVTNLAAVPAAYRSLLAVPGAENYYDLRALRHCTSCGEPLNAGVVEEWKRRFGLHILDGLGMTECMTYVSNLKGMRVKAGSCGRPQPGHLCAILDPQTGEPLPPNEAGNLVIRREDPGLFIRFWSCPQTADQPFFDRWFLTGDIAYYDEDGYYWFLGRADDLISTTEGQVSPFRVESAVIRHPAVMEAAAVPTHDPALGTVVKCFVVLKPGHIPSSRLAQSIIESTMNDLARHARPQEIEFVAELPKTHSGKIKRRMLRELEKGRTPSMMGASDLLAAIADIGAE